MSVTDPGTLVVVGSLLGAAYVWWAGKKNNGKKEAEFYVKPDRVSTFRTQARTVSFDAGAGNQVIDLSGTDSQGSFGGVWTHSRKDSYYSDSIEGAAPPLTASELAYLHTAEELEELRNLGAWKLEIEDVDPDDMRPPTPRTPNTPPQKHRPDPDSSSEEEPSTPDKGRSAKGDTKQLVWAKGDIVEIRTGHGEWKLAKIQTLPNPHGDNGHTGPIMKFRYIEKRNDAPPRIRNPNMATQNTGEISHGNVQVRLRWKCYSKTFDEGVGLRNLRHYSGYKNQGLFVRTSKTGESTKFAHSRLEKIEWVGCPRENRSTTNVLTRSYEAAKQALQNINRGEAVKLHFRREFFYPGDKVLVYGVNTGRQIHAGENETLHTVDRFPGYEGKQGMVIRSHENGSSSPRTRQKLNKNRVQEKDLVTVRFDSTGRGSSKRVYVKHIWRIKHERVEEVKCFGCFGQR